MIAKYKYTINAIPPSNNEYIGKNAQWKYAHEKIKWERMILWTCIVKPPQPIPFAIVTLRYTFKDKRRRDPDNYSGKFILDGLRKAGIILDDSFDNIRLRIEKSDEVGTPKVEIIVEEITDREEGEENDIRV